MKLPQYPMSVAIAACNPDETLGQVAKRIGVVQSAFTSWRQRGYIPERHFEALTINADAASKKTLKGFMKSEVYKQRLAEQAKLVCGA